MAIITFDEYLILPYPNYENSYPPYSAGRTQTGQLITQLTGTTTTAGLSKDVSYLAYNQLRLSYDINVINDVQLLKFKNISTSVASVSTRLDALDLKVSNMAPEVITQSISFLLGAFVALAFVLAAKVRF